jgi:hypothetical protein
MRKVFSSAKQVIHIFAQRSQSQGNSSNVYFDNDKCIYSYGRHYLLGEFVEINGQTSIIINDSGYSSTTSKHISIIRQATRQYNRYNLTEICPRKVLNELKRLQTKLIAAKKPEIYLTSANQLLNSFNSFKPTKKEIAEIKKSQMNYNFDLFNKDEIKEIKKISKVFDWDNYKEVIEKGKQLQAKKDKEIKDIGGKAFLKYMDLWQINSIPENYFDLIPEKTKQLINLYKNKYSEDFLRISGDEIETSQGIKVSISEAKILYKAILSGQDIKGFKIGYYTVISINGVLTIGCHKINMSSVHNVGKEIINK